MNQLPQIITAPRPSQIVVAILKRRDAFFSA
jgi:hypothetical protein